MKHTLYSFLIVLLVSNVAYSQCPTTTLRLNSQSAIDSFSILYPNCTETTRSIWIDDLYLDTIQDITNLQGLSAIKKVSASIQFTNTNLESLDGLERLNVVTGALTLSQNDLLTDISALRNLRTAGILNLTTNPNLTDFSGFDQLNSCNRMNLVDIHSISNLSTIPSTNDLEALDIIRCDSLTSLAGLDYSSLSRIRLIGNQQLSDLNGLEPVTELSELVVSSNPALLSLEGLNALEKVTITLEIKDNEALASFAGLEQLSSIKDLRISRNESLASFEGMENVSELNGLYVKHNPMLQDFAEFEQLTLIEQTISIIDNENLESLDGLDRASSGNLVISYFFSPCIIPFFIDEGLIIRDNPKLESLSALSNRKKVAGDLVISNNDKINNLIGLENIDFVSGNIVTITDNDSLASISSLGNLSRIGSPSQPWIFTVNNNPNLTSIAGPAFEQPGTIEIGSNENLRAITGSRSNELYGLSIGNCPNLDNLTYFNNLSKLSFLSITGCDKLLNLNTFDKINSSLHSLALINNKTLNDISGLRNIEAITPFTCESETFEGRLQISRNPQLSDCAIMPICDALVSPDVSKFINNNGPECNTPEDINCDDVSISGTVFLDTNQNGILETGEPGLPNVSINFNPPNKNVLSNQIGKYFRVCEDGITYQISIPQIPNFSLTSATDTFEITFQQGNSINSNNNFGIYPDINIQDVVSNISSDPTRCNTTVAFHLSVENLGTQVENGHIRLDYDSLALYDDATPVPDSINQDSSFLIWNIEDFTPFDFDKFKVWFQMPDESFTGTVLSMSSSVILDSSGVENVVDEYTYTPTVLCSYDPNDKLVMPPGVQEENYTLKDEKLTYTVRFQNTGNAPAIDVKIIDSLDQNLDLQTFRIVNSSHSLETKINGRVINFVFDNINLIDSLTDESNSHGFVTYEIEPNHDILDFSKIENTAHIIFDFNPPIITNTVENTMVTTIPTSSVHETISESFKIFPNPLRPSQTLQIAFQPQVKNEVLQISLINNLGQVVREQVGKSGINTMRLAKLSPGLYFVKVRFKDERIGISKVLIIE